jgi:protoporphyrinogen/coproporphyrinogen III oxidase
MRSAGTIIVGGGISGASALHWLAAGGEDVLLIEAGDRLGGVIGSYRNDAGALVETGPNSTQLSHPQLVALIEELGLADALMTASPRAKSRYIVRDGALVPTPSGPVDFLTSPLFSTRAKLRLLQEPFIAPAPEGIEESVAQFVERRIGREFLDYAINPFMSGVYAGRPEMLSLRHAFPKLHALEREHGSLIRGMIARRRQTRKARKDVVGAPRVSSLISFSEGMAMLPGRVAERYADRVITGRAVTSIERVLDRWRVSIGDDALEAERVIIATPASAAADLIEGIDGGAAAALRGIVYPPVATITSVYRRDAVEHPLDGFGCLIPEVERRRVLGVIFSSTLFPNRAPDGRVVLTTFIGGARQPEIAGLGESELVTLVNQEHRVLLGVTTDAESYGLTRWQHAIPQYNVGHGRVLDAIAGAERRAVGVHLLGNYRGGVSVGDCVKSAWELASRLLEQRQEVASTGEDARR